MSQEYEEFRKMLSFPVELRHEGRATFLSPILPSTREFAPTSLPAFFNPASKLSRDIAVLFLKAYFEDRKISICEPLAGIGVRSIRLILETGLIDHALVNDISKNAYELIKVNAKINNVEDKLEVSVLDANELLASRGRGKPRFDYVDVDPAGSPAKFMENSFRGCGKNSILGATATDLSALTGSKPLSCLRKYDSYVMKTPFFKEVAVRVLAGFMVRTAARIGLAAEPVFAFLKDYYTRVFVRVSPGIEDAKKLLRQVGWIAYCPRCFTIYTYKIGEESISCCPTCMKPISSSGPLWLGRLCREEIVYKMHRHAYANLELYREAAKLLEEILQEDTSIVGYYPVNSIASILKISPVKPKAIIEELRNRGYKSSTTHFDSTAFKTEASSEVIKEMFLYMLSKK
ncbi:MAG: tRNA (guanine(26)-N(2))-dimethyltransferase [Nitrososphaerota archaeon]